MAIKGVIFDMDGLMFDTERLFTHYWTHACRDYGIPRKEEFVAAVRGSSGEKMRACVREYYGPNLDADGFCRRVYEYVDEHLKETVPKKKGLDELLAFLKAAGLPCAVASSTYRSLVERNLKTAGVEGYFSCPKVPPGGPAYRPYTVRLPIRRGCIPRQDCRPSWHPALHQRSSDFYRKWQATEDCRRQHGTAPAIP